MKIVTVRDIVANAYGNPMFVASLGGAIRSFSDEINKTDGNQLALHPEDYEMYHHGEFVPETGEFEILEKPVQIAAAKNLKRA